MVGVGFPAAKTNGAVSIGEKLAVTLPGPEIAKLCGVVVPGVPLKPADWYPLTGAAEMVTDVPLLYQPLALADVTTTVPAPTGLTEVVSRYCVVKLAV